MRVPLIAGNWKMNMLKKDAADFFDALIPAVKDVDDVNILICPVSTVLDSAAAKIAGTNVKLGAQNMHWELNGAYTGELSPEMLKDVGCEYVIIGHSERRQYFGETNETVNKKVKTALANGLKPIMCCGETLEQRESGETFDFIKQQIVEGLAGVYNGDKATVVVAYEPIWAIGTGKTASKEQAQEVHAFIRKTIKENFGEKIAEDTIIQYGGSVKPANVKELMSQEDIDGALVGGAALKADSFEQLCKFK